VPIFYFMAIASKMHEKMPESITAREKPTQAYRMHGWTRAVKLLTIMYETVYFYFFGILFFCWEFWTILKK
jgi:hypothetical protein